MSRKTVWITRSAGSAQKSKEAWEQAGFDAYINPVIDISIAPTMPKPLPDNAVLLITSQNALRTLALLTDRRDWSVMTVGDASAALAREMGFGDVLSAKGNGQDLLELTQRIYAPESKRIFVHASGANIRLNLAKALREKGYKSRRDIYYQNTPKTVIDLTNAPEITHIALYSPMAAKSVRRFAGRFNKASTISISAQTDRALEARYKNRRLIANRPTERDMISAVLA